MLFEDLELEVGTLNAIAAMGYEEATPIQEQGIPPLLEGRDVVGQARTGTGKTAAFGIPMINGLRNSGRGVRGLVVLPTRELAIQVAEVLTDLAKGTKIEVVPVYGGAGFGKQIDSLVRKTTQIVVACPGRLLDLVQRGDVDLGLVEYFVLDEADRMLDMGFVRDMRRISSLVPRERQTALFTATIPQSVEKLIQEFTNRPVRIKTDNGETTVPQAEQFVVKVEKTAKTDKLLHLLADEQPERAVVFTRTKHLAKRLALRLSKEGWSSVALQGNMTQGQRERAMASFRGGQARMLVATDVAARGLDVPGITHVVNFDLPDPEQYVHRVGRTARNGASGRAFTFLQSDEHKDFRDVEKFAGRRLDPHTIVDVPSVLGPDPVVTAPQAAGARPAGPKGNQGRGNGQGQGRGRGAPRNNQGRSQSSQSSQGNQTSRFNAQGRSGDDDDAHRRSGSQPAEHGSYSGQSKPKSPGSRSGSNGPQGGFGRAGGHGRLKSSTRGPGGPSRSSGGNGGGGGGPRRGGQGRSNGGGGGGGGGGRISASSSNRRPSGSRQSY